MDDFTELTQITFSDGRTFTRREHQILAMLAYGFNSDKIIADYLETSLRTVQNTAGEVRRRNGWRSRGEMARYYANQTGLY
jgi:DNA-binding CsgD family transcriptional regulator